MAAKLQHADTQTHVFFSCISLSEILGFLDKIFIPHKKKFFIYLTLRGNTGAAEQIDSVETYFVKDTREPRPSQMKRHYTPPHRHTVSKVIQMRQSA